MEGAALRLLRRRGNEKERLCIAKKIRKKRGLRYLEQF